MRFSVDVNVQEWKVAFFFFHCKLFLVVESDEVVLIFCQFFLAMGPNDESVIYISEPRYRFVYCCSAAFFSKSSMKNFIITGISGEPIATPSICS